MPRAWLVSEAEAVDGEEALRRIRGESLPEFDPTRTALIEVPQAELPVVPGGVLATRSKVRVVSYEANRLSYETDAPTATILIASEIFYPGWEASVDGKPTRIMVTDYLLRGVALTAGQHRIEMSYHTPAARNGVIISILTLLILLGLVLSTHRARAA